MLRNAAGVAEAVAIFATRLSCSAARRPDSGRLDDGGGGLQQERYARRDGGDRAQRRRDGAVAWRIAVSRSVGRIQARHQRSVAGARAFAVGAERLLCYRPLSEWDFAVRDDR